jgi:hypothetical protein
VPYVDPHTVLSPRSRLREIVEVLHDDGPSCPYGWSAAVLDWDGERCLGLRWNGGDDSAVGNPQSRGQATWFIVPKPLSETVLRKLQEMRDGALAEGYREMAADAVREREAAEWCEAGLEDEDADPR